MHETTILCTLVQCTLPFTLPPPHAHRIYIEWIDNKECITCFYYLDTASWCSISASI
uniref:Ovule protein n=1 Tax=Haemonchus contortus TaxID=6289 RepID=A0A7I5E7G1_HAECO